MKKAAGDHGELFIACISATANCNLPIKLIHGQISTYRYITLNHIH